MKNIKILIASLVVLVLGSSVFAFYGEHSMFNSDFHEKMEQVVENGTYQDLVNLRNEIDMPIARWVDSEDSFNSLKERHEDMENSGYDNNMNNNHEENMGNHFKNSRGFSGGCQFMD